MLQPDPGRAAANRNDWVSLHRDYRPDELNAPDVSAGGTSEIPMRNQFQAWVGLMGAA